MPYSVRFVVYCLLCHQWRASGFSSLRGTIKSLTSTSSKHSLSHLHSTSSSNDDQQQPKVPLNYEDELLPDPLEIPELRQVRWEKEKLVKSKYKSGDDLFELRSEISNLRNELIDVRQQQQMVRISNPSDKRMRRRIVKLEQRLLDLCNCDAEWSYGVAAELHAKALSSGDEELVKKYKNQMEEARLCIPQLNLHGLWVGKYGDHGYEMINVTYSGDTLLVATKVTGDQNVPKGKVSFNVDLSPQISDYRMSASSTLDHAMSKYLEPIKLNQRARKQWNRQYLPRFLGKGQVSGSDYSNPTWLEGQLIIVGRFFSFAWIPLGHQVFFGRPSSELTIKMLKESRKDELRRDHVAVMRDAVESAWDETYWTEKEIDSYWDGTHWQ